MVDKGDGDDGRGENFFLSSFCEKDLKSTVALCHWLAVVVQARRPGNHSTEKTPPMFQSRTGNQKQSNGHLFILFKAR